MNNEELIEALQCASHFALYQDCYERNCYANSGKGLYCNIPKLMADAADALEVADKRIAELEAQLPEEGEWIMDEHPHDGDCRCSVCLIAIDAMHERNHGLLNALTGGKWWKFYKYCPNCGAKMKGDNDEQIH